MMNRPERLLHPLIVMLALAACAGAPPQLPAAGGDQRSLAERAYAEGRYGAARAGFEELAAAQPQYRDRWLLRAADAALQDREQPAARILLGRVDPARLVPEELSLLALLTAALERETLPPHRRLALLDIESATLDEAFRPLLHELRAQVLLETGQPYASARERVRLAPYLLAPEAAERNRAELFRALQPLTTAQARRLTALHRREDPMLGWLELVVAAKEAVFAGRSLPMAVEAWQREFPNHPANLEITDRILADYDRGFSRPDAVALLLPEAGSLSRAAEAVRDGFVTAYLSAGGTGELRHYDSGPSPAEAVQAYRRALEDGAGVIVGPLEREAATAVLREADGSVPLLALNYAEGEGPGSPGTFQFGLLPEAEAAAAAEEMLREGRSRAIVLTPASTWGDRLRDAFIDRYLALGGLVFDAMAYPEGAGDFGAMIERAVGITAARERQRALQRDLGIPLNLEPPRRPDLDALFLAARPREGRLIKPQLAFHNASDLPVFATSHVYSGTEDGTVDRDLNGVTFCDAPWVIGSQRFSPELAEARALFPSAEGAGARLFALGVDAYRVLPYLEWLTRFSDDRFPGLTGQLAVTAGGVLERSPDCARFEGGRPRYRQAAPAAESTGP